MKTNYDIWRNDEEKEAYYDEDIWCGSNSILWYIILLLCMKKERWRYLWRKYNEILMTNVKEEGQLMMRRISVFNINSNIVNNVTYRILSL